MKKMFHIKYVSVIFIFSLLITFSYYATKTMFLQLETGQVVETDIVSPQTITYTDEEETKKQLEKVLSEVQAAYDMDPKVHQTQIDELKTFLNSVIEAKKAKEENEQVTKTLVQTQEVVTGTLPVTKDYIAEIKNPYGYTKEELQVFFNTDAVELSRMRDVFSKELENFYAGGIVEEKIDEQKTKLLNNPFFYHYSEKPRNLLLDKMTSRVKANFVLNDEQTKIRKTEAEKSITAITHTIQRGEIIVRANEVLTDKQYQALKAVGVVNEKFDIKDALSRLPFIFLMLLSLHLMLYRFSFADIENERLYLFVFSVIFIFTFTANFFQNEYFTFTLLALSLFAITTFLSPSVSIIFAIVLGLLIHTGDYAFLIKAIMLGVVQTLGHNSKGDRDSFLYLGVASSAILVVTHFVTAQIMNTQLTWDEYYPLIAGPFVASIFVLGLFTYLEKMLGVVTSLKLHELSRPNKNKLMQRLINEAPGTFHHSLKVGNLAEAAADAIGANALLLKVGAIYHDAGKLEHPLHFIENLSNPESNPHNTLTPKESAAYIKQHPIDSVKLCKKYKLPEQIIDLIERHHGDDIIKYFYKKELEANPNCDINDFKYQTPVPVTKEEGILMLADVTEAYSRTIMHEAPEVFRQKITDLIYAKVEEGQLRECELTMKEIGIIIQTFVDYMLRSNHKRISYPGQN